MLEVVFDVETKKFFDDTGTLNPADLGVSIVSAYFREVDEVGREVRGEIKSFWEKDFGEMWTDFFRADRIIGFNSQKFDVPALLPYAPKGFSRLPHFDIIEKVQQACGHKVSLNAIAKDTLGEQKTDVGSNAIVYWNRGDPESLHKLQSYCEADVLLTKKIYDHGCVHKELKFTDYWNTPKIITVDFSYNFLSGVKQESLF